MATGIDLNCDVGEGVGNEALLFPYISSCNIATGGHAGDVSSMTQVASLAKAQQLRIGAHPSYPDRANFGRVSLEMEKQEFQESMRSQLNSIREVLSALNLKLDHIKAHGALYNDLAKGGALADAYLQVMEPFRGECVLYVPCGSEFAKIARDRGFEIWEEAFADRAYHSDGRLVSRSVPGAVLTDPEAVCNQVLQMISENRVMCTDGSFLHIQPDTICVHGDNPEALEILKRLRSTLFEASIPVKNE